MKTLLLTSSLLLAASCAFGGDETIEPPLNYTLKVGEASYAVLADQPFEIAKIDAAAPALLTADKFRVFPYRNVKFKYPSYYTYEASLKDPLAQNWTISGNDCKIMLFVLFGKISVKEFGESLAEQLGKDNSTIRETSVKLGSETYKGVTVDCVLAGSRILMDVLPLSDPSGRTKLIVIQDSVSDEGKHSEEHANLMKLFEESFAESK